ncbi:MAG: hypothetical protein HRT44_05160 [Bdellovibrionales bacterium]|nr:hypothetical protein [Bdellovibrionales bacterium]NQZ18631.1 hypothetical protein [Bdellovibrionales bacterium]
MNTWTFFMTMMAINLMAHLMRLPHLVMNHGGGAFLILFIILIHLVSLPVILSEIALGRSRLKTSLKDHLRVKKASGSQKSLRLFVRGFALLQITLLFSFAVFFIYMTGLSFLHIFQFAALSIDVSFVGLELKSYPPLSMSLSGLLGLLSLAYAVGKWRFKVFLSLSTRWLLPFSISIFLVVFIKILFSMSDYAGLRTLFYPDFSHLNSQTLFFAIGQALIGLFVGLSFFNQPLLLDPKKDPIRIVINLVIQSIIISLFIVGLALPALEQNTATPFGAGWVFTILPRWLSYGEFGYYYCFLFYIALFYIFFFLLVMVLKKGSELLQGFWEKPYNLEFMTSAVFSFVSCGTYVFYQQPFKAWWGQGLFVKADFFVVNILLPLTCVGVVAMMFFQTTKEERKSLFKHQQVFYHSSYFFKFWQWTARYLVPGLVLISLILFFI